MAKKTNKQMRISASHYAMINKIAEELDIDRSEVISNALVLIKFLIDNKAISIKVVCKNGMEKELMTTLLINNSED